MSNCVYCAKNKACKYENGTGLSDCPTANESELVSRCADEYKSGKYSEFMHKSLEQVASGYEISNGKPCPVKTRLEEIIEFCHRMNYTKIGLAFCTALEDDARIFADILRENGLCVVSAVCKVGGLKKEEVGLCDSAKIIPGRREISCNPIMQAELMNEANTDFNIVFGLCLGHDSLFLKHSDALCTVFVVKDRVLGHNPIQAIRDIAKNKSTIQ